MKRFAKTRGNEMKRFVKTRGSDMKNFAKYNYIIKQEAAI
jgi:hypothetical protein